MGSSENTEDIHSYSSFKLCRWLRTGDQVFFKENGDIFIVERIKVGEALLYLVFITITPS